MAQSSRELVQQAPARCYRSRHLYFRRRSKAQDPTLHPSLSEDGQALSVEILRCSKTDSRLVAMSQGQPTRSLLKNSLAVAFRSIQTSSQYAWRRPTTIQCVQLCVAGGSGARGSSASGDPEVGG